MKSGEIMDQNIDIKLADGAKKDFTQAWKILWEIFSNSGIQIEEKAHFDDYEMRLNNQVFLQQS